MARKTQTSKAQTSKTGPALDDLRIDVDLDEAARQAERVKTWLMALRKRHDLSPFEYTKLVRIVPAGPTYSHPILTLGTRFTETEDQLLATYLHEQMHWYLYLLGGPDHDPVTPFFDELVRRYPDAPTHLPEGARNYEQTYMHLVVNWLELATTGTLIGRARAEALANTTYGYRWIYRTVLRDWDALGALFTTHGITPLIPAPVLLADPNRGLRPQRIKIEGAARQRTPSKAPPLRSRQGRRKPPARGGRSAG